MIEILPVMDIETVRRILAEREIACNQPILLLAHERDAEIGGVAFTLGKPGDDAAELLDVWTAEEGDMPLFDGIVRAAASFLYERGRKKLVSREERLKEKLIAVGFNEISGETMALLPQFFQKCKK